MNMMTNNTGKTNEPDDYLYFGKPHEYEIQNLTWKYVIQAGGEQLLTITQDGDCILHIDDEEIELDMGKLKTLLKTCAKDKS